MAQWSIRYARERGQTSLSWLQSFHTFSFGDYFDEKHLGFSDLLVINEDFVAPKGGFATHPHRNMEIFTYILSGSLQHRDSMGNGSVIVPSDIQIMSAGTGITHSEFNPSEDTPVHLLQIWIEPNRKELTPRYAQKSFSLAEKRNKFRLVLSPDEAEGSVKIFQDVRLYVGLFDEFEKVTYTPPPDRVTYLHVACGILSIHGETLGAGDAMSFLGAEPIVIDNAQKAEVLLFDLRPRAR